jgi:hypothetical protein
MVFRYLCVGRALVSAYFQERLLSGRSDLRDIEASPEALVVEKCLLKIQGSPYRIVGKGTTQRVITRQGAGMTYREHADTDLTEVQWWHQNCMFCLYA